MSNVPASGRFLLNSLSERISHGGSLTIAAKEDPEPHRPARRGPGADAPQGAGNEPGATGRGARHHLPASAEMREGRQPHRGQPVAANLTYPAGASGVLLRGRAKRISATRFQWKRVSDGPNDFISDSDGLRLIGAFMRIDNAALRRRIVMLVQEIAGDDD